MKIEKRIVGANPANQQLAVVFFTDEDLGEIGPFAVDVPFVDGAFLSGAALDAHIMGFAPRADFERRLAIKNMSVHERGAIGQLVQAQPVAAAAPNSQTKRVSLQQRAISGVQGKEGALEVLDRYAELCRSAFVTPGDGQALTYVAKLEAAKRFHQTGLSHPLLQADVDAGIVIGQREAASAVVEASERWMMIAAQIDAIRLGAKRQVRAAASLEDYRAIVTEAIGQFDRVGQ
ncbi:MAG TPA: hypothetical protein VFP29_12505 [Methyloceanibacter sp.]|nr:hypothetical protein [Methyloceanibacter sp.]